ncbi:MAG: glutaminyl-peptide cyclotransferase [Salinivirgaceae bacterium]|jgi:glutamine cyclotransferase|nr:glutaminyl-peptide cyclotransferase [Bacteroidales bacterium]
MIHTKLNSLFYNSATIAIFLFFAIILNACNSQPTSRTDEVKTTQPKYSVSITKPSRNDVFRIEDEISFNFRVSDSIKFDSIKIIINNLDIISFNDINAVKWNSTNAKTGSNHVRFVFHVDTLQISSSTSLRFLAANKPIEYGYKIVNTYPHDTKAYTQGLMFEDGYLYESTGQYNESSLRKIDLKTGKVLKQYDLPDEDFGEGIARYEDKIYLLTWESKKGYVFNLQTFDLVLEFPISTEGWGLTYDDKHLIRSDGTHILHFISPEQFSEVGTIEVYDHERKITRLNELEYYDNKIWANVYGEDYIVTIDPKSGQVLEKIDLQGLLSEQDRRNYRVDVLNGIAWDRKNRRLFVTGKLWPKLFEIELVKK